MLKNERFLLQAPKIPYLRFRLLQRTYSNVPQGEHAGNSGHTTLSRIVITQSHKHLPGRGKASAKWYIYPGKLRIGVLRTNCISSLYISLSLLFFFFCCLRESGAAAPRQKWEECAEIKLLERVLEWCSLYHFNDDFSAFGKAGLDRLKSNKCRPQAWPLLFLPFHTSLFMVYIPQNHGIKHN